MHEHNEHHEHEEHEEAQAGISRRSALRRGAVLGGSLMWTVPAVQSVSRAALAQTNGTPPPSADDCCTADAFGLQVAIPLLGIAQQTFGVNGCAASVDVGAITLGTGATVEASTVCGEPTEQPGGPCTGSASVANLAVSLRTPLADALDVSASVITSDAVATCGADCSVTGSSQIASLSINGTDVDISNLLGHCNVDVLGLGLVTFNRQQCNGDTLTVDALHINVLDLLEVTVARGIAQGDGCSCTECA